CEKWELMKPLTEDQDVYPMWVADMELPVCDEVIEAISKRLKCPIFGYTMPKQSLYDSICEWHNRRYDYGMDESDICFSTSVLSTLSLMLRMFTEKGDKVIVPTPHYYQFCKKIKMAEREVLAVPLKCKAHRYVFDFEELEKVVDDQTKLLILCNPHNPSGTIYTKEELEEVSDFCQKHKLMIFSDEIHMDVVFHQQKIIPFMTISDYAKNHTISAISISKTFNLAGMKISCAIIKNPSIREAFKVQASSHGMASINLLAYEAMEASYRHGDAWLEEALNYIEHNRQYAVSFIEKDIPSLKTHLSDATYFLWVDFRESGLPTHQLKEILLKEAKVLISDGSEFHKEYIGFVRFNLSCPKQAVVDVFNRIKVVVDQYQKR
ncbi:MAG: MalY/PatB family protein, partial [Erysipelotrichaceae bacterium]